MFSFNVYLRFEIVCWIFYVHLRFVGCIFNVHFRFEIGCCICTLCVMEIWLSPLSMGGILCFCPCSLMCRVVPYTLGSLGPFCPLVWLGMLCISPDHRGCTVMYCLPVVRSMAVSAHWYDWVYCVSLSPDCRGLYCDVLLACSEVYGCLNVSRFSPQSVRLSSCLGKVTC